MFPEIVDIDVLPFLQFSYSTLATVGMAFVLFVMHAGLALLTRVSMSVAFRRLQTLFDAFDDSRFENLLFSQTLSKFHAQNNHNNNNNNNNTNIDKQIHENKKFFSSLNKLMLKNENDSYLQALLFEYHVIFNIIQQQKQSNEALNDKLKQLRKAIRGQRLRSRQGNHFLQILWRVIRLLASLTWMMANFSFAFLVFVRSFWRGLVRKEIIFQKKKI